MLSIKESSLLNAGQGLWAERDFKRGDIICKYEGEKVTWKECCRRNDAYENICAYFFYITERNCIDAQYNMDSFARYANDAAGISRIKGIKNNSYYKIIRKEPYIVASRNIKAGEEIFVAYGRAYWNSIRKSLEN